MDGVELEILWSNLIGIVTERAKALQRIAFSPVVREAGDLACALFDRRGRMVAQANTGTPGHINSLAIAGAHLVRIFANNLKPGDVVTTNDPWLSAGHFFDITVLTPIFDGDRILAYIGSTIHHTDIGGYGIGAGARDVHEEGLWIPPLKLYNAGEPCPVLHAVIKSNVRTPDAVFGDLAAQVSSGRAASERLIGMCRRYGLPDIEQNLKLDAPLAQRVALKYRLDHLNADSTEAYIKHRLRLAGAARMPFTPGAVESVHRFSSGTPRVINTLCDNALFEGYVARVPMIDEQMIERVARDLALDGSPPAGALASPAPRSDHVAVPVASTAAPIAEIADWPTFVAGMKLSGIALQLAAQTELKAFAGNELVLAVPEASRHLTDKAYADKLKAALDEAFGRRMRLRFEVGGAATASLAVVEKRERAEAQSKTEAAFRDDPFVQDLLARFDARIKPDSIKPVS